MSALKLIFIFYICANCVCGLYVPSSSAGVETDDKKLIDDLTIVKQKLQPNDKGVSGLDEFDVTKNDFNEFELIRLIPSVIEQLKTNRLTTRDRSVLSEIYGDLWLVMDEESKRDREHEKINPILKLILQFKHKREIDRHAYTNDYHDNTLVQIRNNDRDIVDQPLRIKMGLTENLAQLSPSQRILRTIAMLINNKRFNYTPTVHKKQMGQRKRKHMRIRPNVIRMRRSALRHQMLNNNIGNDIDLYDSDEQFYRRRMSSFDDNPSITELIKLAEIHRLRRQQKFNKNSFSIIDKLYAASTSDNYDYYYDDEPESNDNNAADEDDDEYEEDDSEYDY